MKAAVLYANDDIRYEEYQNPEILPRTVKIRVRVSGICGSDIPRVLNNAAHYYPIVLGHEFSGDVVETGEGVKSLSVGDTVSGVPLIPCFNCPECQKGAYSLCKNYSFIGSREQGSFAEYIVVPEHNAVKYVSTPENPVSYEQAAFFEPSTVALHGLLNVGFEGGENVAILGGGTIGVFAMQWAKIFGARKTTVFDIDDGRLELAKRLGADETVNTANTERESSDDRFGYVFETAGAPQTIKMAFDVAGNRAKVCYIGTPSIALTFAPGHWENINRKELWLTGSWMSYSAPFPGKEWELTAHYFANGMFKFDESLIFRTFPLSRAAEAFALFKEPSRVHGKVLLVNDNE